MALWLYLIFFNFKKVILIFYVLGGMAQPGMGMMQGAPGMMQMGQHGMMGQPGMMQQGMMQPGMYIVDTK